MVHGTPNNVNVLELLIVVIINKTYYHVSSKKNLLLLLLLYKFIKNSDNLETVYQY